MSLFLLLILCSFSNDGSQVSQSEDKAVRREKKRRKKRDSTIHGWQNLVLSSFFLLPFFFLSFLWLLLLVINNYYWTRLRCVASDPGNSWCSVKKRVLSFEGFLVILETLLFLSFFLMTLSFLNSFFLVFRDNECWLCLSSLCLFYFCEF